MENKRTITVINVISIIMLVMCLALGGILIILSRSKTEIDIATKGIDKLKNNYTTTEATTSTNTWEISATENDDVTATLSDDGLLTISGTGNMKDWEWNSKTEWHGMRNEVKTVIIENEVTNIGDDAFKSCYNLTSIEIPSSVTSIGENAFDGCHVYDVIYTSNDTIEIPNILKRAQDENDILYSNSEFNILNCTIESNTIKINDATNYAVIGIESGALKGLEYYISYNTWNISATENDNVTATLSIDGTLTIAGTGDMKNWNYRSTTDWHGVRSKVKKVIIEKGVTSLGDGAFDNCTSLISIEIPKSVTSIGDGAFATCYSLTSIEVDQNNVNYKDENGVLYTKNGSKIIKYPEGKTETEYKILSGVKDIGDGAFSFCVNLRNVEIPEGVRSIGVGAFAACLNFASIKIPEGVISIADISFAECASLTSIEIPESVISIGYDVFTYSPNVTIICNKNTTAEAYAKENNIKYIIKIDGIDPKTTVQQLKQKLENEKEYEIINQDGEKILETAYVGTGYKVKMADGTIYTIIVTGYANGDGKSDIQDIFAINKHRLSITKLTIEYLLAGDVDKNDQTDIKDIFQINKYRLGNEDAL